MKDANIEDPGGKNIEEEQLPTNTYKIIEPPPENLDDRSTTTGLFIYPDVNAEARAEQPAGKPHTPQPQLPEPLTERILKIAEKPAKFYAKIGVGLVVLLVLIIVAVTLLTSNPEGRNDMGLVISSGMGLKGHLYIKWEKRLHYRLTFEADDPEKQSEFALAVANSPRPLSIDMELQDAEGIVLCSREIALKYDARNAAAITANHANKPPAEIDLARLQAQELEREEGKDIFQYQIAPNGQVASIIAQGEIPCSTKAYEKTTQWNFSTDFPSLVEQDEWLESRPDLRINADQRSAAHKKSSARAAEKLLPFSIEGDDAIVEFDVNRGVIETSGRKTFFLDKTIMASASPVWQEYPVNIHFRCDQSTNCTLMHSGAGALRVRLKR
jgi:hypothetical protein